MLNVSGVGENKFSKYGESFLSVVEKCAGEYPELLINKVDAAKEKEKPTLSKASKKNEKQEFYLLEEEAANFNYADYMYVSEIKKELERICERHDGSGQEMIWGKDQKRWRNPMKKSLNM